MRLPEEPDLPPQIYLAPMIDVVFALLSFFILSTLFLTRSQGLPVALPKASTAEAQKTTQINVTIDQNSNLFLDQQPTKLATIDQQVRSIMSSKRQSIVILNADRRVPHGTVIAVMDRLRTIQGIRIGIATEQP